MPRFSLKTKATLFFPLGISIGLAGLLFFVHSYLQDFIRTSISTQQYQMVSLLAEDIDSSINERQRELIVIAGKITRKMVEDPRQAFSYLKLMNEHLVNYDNGMFLFNRKGQIVAELPLGLTRLNKDFSFRDYLKQTTASQKPFISDPYISSQLHHPAALMFTVPVFDTDGSMIAILGGSVSLSRSSFIEKLSRIKLSKGGYFYLINQNRVLISHPDNNRIMKPEATPGSNKLLDRAIAGFDGTDESIDSHGLHTLTSFKHLKTKNWIIAANYPIAEAYAPIYRLNILFIILLPLTSLGTFWLMRRILDRFTEPIVQLTRHVDNLTHAHGELRMLPASGADEIAVLGQTFNHLVQKLDQQAGILTKREEKFRMFFEESSDAIFIVSTDGLILEANQEACQRYGYKHSEFVGMPVFELDTPEEGAHIQERISRLMEDGKTTFESIHRRKHDQPLAVEINASLIELDGERFILAVARDITNRNKAEALLHRQNEYLTTLHETTLGLISRLDVSSLLQTIVTRAGKLVGTEHCFVYLINADGTMMDMLFQSGIYDSLTHHPIAPGQGIAGRVWNTGEPFRVDDYLHWDGRLPDSDRDVLHAMAGVPLKADHKVIGVLGLAFIDPAVTFNDEQMELLTQFGELASLALDNARLYDAAQKELIERTKAEEELRKLSHAVEQSPVSIIITNLHGDIEYANPHFTNLTGYSLEELLGQNPRILKSGFTTQTEYRDLWETILSGHEWRGEFQNIKKNGDLYWELALISPIRNSSFTITHFMAIKEDITEQKKMENQLRHSQKMEAVGQLAGGIAHDFNNILTAIIGYTTILQMKSPENSPLKSTTDQILASAERGASLTQGLLAFSRKEINNPGRIDLNGILNRVEKLLLRLIGEDIRLTTVPSEQPLLVMADSIQMEQVLMNLATNARDAMPEGGEITISTEAVKLDSHFITAHGFGNSGQFALLTVSDTGHGMDAETVKRIFEPFYTTKDTGKGTGLGLSIVYGIIKKHNGFILCHSLPGIGTIFHVYLPLTEGDELPCTEHAAKSPYQPGSTTILLAEDDEQTRSMSKELLEEFGYIVIEARDGVQAVDSFREHCQEISLVILDAVMPGMKGMDVYQEIRTVSPEKRVIICSGYTADIMEGREDLDQHLHFIAKPFMPKELLMKIREVLENAD
ncbi:MAG: PAS domain S-box protein [Geobacteraceae bacterium]|nr:PAS domain S-box protein [Geobacteraceae bacterium]